MSSRIISISMRASAIQSWMLALSATGLPKVTRDCGALAHQLQRPFGHADRAHAVVDAPGPEPGLADREARRPRPSSTSLGRAPARPRSRSRRGPRGPGSRTPAGRARTVTPGASIGTTIIDCWRCGGAAGSVLPITIMTLQFLCKALEVEPLAAVEHVLVAVALDHGQSRCWWRPSWPPAARSSRTPIGSRPPAAA